MGESRRKLLFVISNDYGELSGAMYLAMGGAFEVVMALPPRLYGPNQGGLPYRAHGYESVEDVLGIVGRERPDVVLLFSGYLYAINGIFKLAAVAALVEGVTKEGRRVVTSDPFLGLMGEIGPGTFNERHPLKRVLAEHFSGVFRVLKEVVHIYPADVAGGGGMRSVCFFNPGMVIGAEEAAGVTRRVGEVAGVDAGRKRWLFVLSAEDYAAQVNLMGRGAFEEILVARLRDAAGAGRQAVLVGPDACIGSIRAVAWGIEGALLLSFCGLEQFRLLLLEAEFAFYWNMLSNSILTRAANALPVFFFDRGHMLLAMPAMYELAMARYYSGATLPWLDQRRQLVGDELARRAEAGVREIGRAMASMGRLPRPEGAIDAIMRGETR